MNGHDLKGVKKFLCVLLVVFTVLNEVLICRFTGVGKETYDFSEFLSNLFEYAVPIVILFFSFISLCAKGIAKVICCLISICISIAVVLGGLFVLLGLVCMLVSSARLDPCALILLVYVICTLFTMGIGICTLNEVIQQKKRKAMAQNPYRPNNPYVENK